MRNFIITVDGKSYEVGVEEVGAGEGGGTLATPIAETKSESAPKPIANVKGEQVKAPFNGLIKQILLENGAQVKKNQPILILEAMKMDNEITAPCDGKVTYQVTKGANVEPDAILAVIS